MGICKRTNLTLIIKAAESIKGVLDIEGNTLTGSVGKSIDDLLDKFPNRQCRLIKSSSFGVDFKNGSYSGALQLLKSKEADLLFLPSTTFFTKDFLWPSQTIYADSHVISHTIKNPKIKEVDLVTLLDFLNRMKLLLFITAVVFVLVAFLIYDRTKPNLNYRIKFKKILFNFFKFKLNFKHPACKIGLILLFYNIFLMLFKLIFANSIQTSKVVVETGDLINSEDQLLKTDKVVCWIKDDIEISLAIASPKHSFIRRLYDEKKYDRLTKDMDGEYSYDCLLSIMKLGNTIDLEDKVLFMQRSNHYVFLAYFINYEQNTRLWISDKAFMETVNVYQYRRGLNYFQRRTIDENNQRRLQSGISAKEYDNILMKFKSIIKLRAKMYTNLKQYIDDNTIFTNLDFKYFKNLFLIKILFEFAVFSVFSIFYLKSKRIIDKFIGMCLELFDYCSKLFDFVKKLFKKLTDRMKKNRVRQV